MDRAVRSLPTYGHGRTGRGFFALVREAINRERQRGYLEAGSVAAQLDDMIIEVRSRAAGLTILISFVASMTIGTILNGPMGFGNGWLAGFFVAFGSLAIFPEIVCMIAERRLRARLALGRDRSARHARLARGAEVFRGDKVTMDHQIGFAAMKRNAVVAEQKAAASRKHSFAAQKRSAKLAIATTPIPTP
jgi:hypothetical protein